MSANEQETTKAAADAAAAAAAAAAMPSNPKEFIDQFVTRPMSAQAVNDMSMAFKKAMIGPALGAELSYCLGYRPSGNRPEDASNCRNGARAKTGLRCGECGHGKLLADLQGNLLSMKKLFTERHGAAKPRVAETLDALPRDALLNLVRARMDEEWFGLRFPEKCRDGHAHAGTDFNKLQTTMDGYGLLWPGVAFDPDSPPTDGKVFDLVEFAYEHVAEALNPDFHSYWSHSHYTYDQQQGQTKFATAVNRIFERNGVAFHLVEGEISRIAPAILDEGLAQTLFHTGDAELNKMLQAAREKFLNRALDVRREALEKLWDAWERLKTVEPGKDKKASVKALLDRVSNEPMFQERLDTEAAQLTEIGNKFMIRHSEIDKIPIADSAQVDYLFHRMFAFIRIVLKATGRGG